MDQPQSIWDFDTMDINTDNQHHIMDSSTVTIQPNMKVDQDTQSARSGDIITSSNISPQATSSTCDHHRDKNNIDTLSTKDKSGLPTGDPDNGDILNAVLKAVDVDTNTDDDDMGVDKNATYSCDGCRGMISGVAGSVWYRCTDCVDVDLCRNCFVKDVHSQHKRHISKFVCPSADDIPKGYCDACGFVFATDLSYERNCYQCAKCEDLCICTSCKGRLMHINHSKHLKRVPVEQYLDDIT